MVKGTKNLFCQEFFRSLKRNRDATDCVRIAVVWALAPCLTAFLDGGDLYCCVKETYCLYDSSLRWKLTCLFHSFVSNIRS